AFHVSGIEYFRTQGIKSNPLAGISETGQPGGAAFNWMPGGWYDQNLLVIAKYHRDYMFPVVDVTNRLVKPELTIAMNTDLGRRRMGPYNIFAKLLLPDITGFCMRDARAQTFIDETRLAIALERCRMAHNEIPDSLSALVPQFIPQVPNDLFDGQPL